MTVLKQKILVIHSVLAVIFFVILFSEKMSLPWAKNLVGISLTDEEMKDIPNPVVELGVHVTLKTVQAFGLIGTLVIAPISTFRGRGTFARLATKFGKRGVLLGLVMGPALTYGKLQSIKFDEKGVYDRCYRLRNNYNQVRVDRGSIVGAVAGGGLFPVLGSCPVLGSLVGMSTGVIAMAAYNQSQSKK